MKTQKWIKRYTTSLQGKTIAISGATGGIGIELCHFLCTLGANIILLDRNKAKSEILQQKLRTKYSSVSISGITIDLEKIEDVKFVAEKLKTQPLHGLILNAGAYFIPRHRCSTGYDNIFQINFLSPYILTKLLFEHLQKFDGKVIAVGSIAHTYSKTDANDIDFATRKKHSKAYGNAKRFLMFSLYGLFENRSGLAVTHPGITFTNITAHYPKIIFALIKHPMKIIFMKPRHACLSILYGLFEDCKKNEWIGPKYFRIWGLPKKQTLHTCTESESKWIEATAEKIFQQVL